jgi:hypothetical protein
MGYYSRGHVPHYKANITKLVQPRNASGYYKYYNNSKMTFCLEYQYRISYFYKIQVYLHNAKRLSVQISVLIVRINAKIS